MNRLKQRIQIQKISKYFVALKCDKRNPYGRSSRSLRPENDILIGQYKKYKARAGETREKRTWDSSDSSFNNVLTYRVFKAVASERSPGSHDRECNCERKFSRRFSKKRREKCELRDYNGYRSSALISGRLYETEVVLHAIYRTLKGFVRRGERERRAHCLRTLQFQFITSSGRIGTKLARRGEAEEFSFAL